MADLDEIEAHLRAHREDWESWLVYADHLIEQGDRRGEIIAIADALRKQPAPERRKARARIRAIHEESRERWLPASFHKDSASVQWFCGFPVAIHLHKIDPRPLIEALIAHRGTQFLRELSFSDLPLGVGAIGALCESPFLPQIESLCFDECKIHSEALRTLIEREDLSLRSLSLQCRLGEDDLSTLASSRILSGLQTLSLSHNIVYDNILHTLVSTDHLRDLVNLYLQHSAIDDNGALVLASAEVLGRLEHLSLNSNFINDDAMIAVASSPSLRSLSCLEANDNALSDDAMNTLAAHMHERKGTLFCWLSSRPPSEETRTLDELEGTVWGEATYDSYLVTTCYRLRKVPIGTFSLEDLRIMIGQNIGLPFLVPLALEALDRDPLAEGDYFRGDLLLSLLRADPSFWEERPDLLEAIERIVGRATDVSSMVAVEIAQWRSAQSW